MNNLPVLFTIASVALGLFPSATKQIPNNISVASHEVHGIWNHRQLNPFFNSLVQIRTTNRTSNLLTPGPWWGEVNLPVDSSREGPVRRKVFFMCWHIHSIGKIGPNNMQGCSGYACRCGKYLVSYGLRNNVTVSAHDADICGRQKIRILQFDRYVVFSHNVADIGYTRKSVTMIFFFYFVEGGGHNADDRLKLCQAELSFENINVYALSVISDFNTTQLAEDEYQFININNAMDADVLATESTHGIGLIIVEYSVFNIRVNCSFWTEKSECWEFFHRP